MRFARDLARRQRLRVCAARPNGRCGLQSQFHRQSPPSLVVVSPKPPSDAPANGRAPAIEQPPAVPTVTASEIPMRVGVSVLGSLTITGAKRSRRGLRAAALELIAYLALNQ